MRSLYKAPCLKDEESDELKAALEILEQLHIRPDSKILVLGDGKLGLTIALALSCAGLNVTQVGKHIEKLNITKNQGVKTLLLDELAVTKTWDVVVEATGSVNGFETALALTKPRGVLVLKSTVASGKEFNFAPIVVDEITILGSRCGQFEPALRLLEYKRVDFKPLITDVFDVDMAVDAFERNKEKSSIKVLIKF